MPDLPLSRPQECRLSKGRLMEDQKVKPFAVSGDLPVGKEKGEGLGRLTAGQMNQTKFLRGFNFQF